MSDKISIEKVIDSIQLENGATFGSYISKNGNIYEIIEKAMLEFGKQLLELAAENAKLMDNGRVLSSNRYTIEAHDVYYVETEIEVSKQSILDAIKQIE